MSLLLSLAANIIPSFLLNGLKSFFDYRKSIATSEARTEQTRIEWFTRAAIESRKASAQVIQAGMQFKVFWIPWLIVTIPLSVWFAWGMTDTIANGALPDVAEIPPGLKLYADQAWGSIFYSGGGVASAQVLGKTITAAIRERKRR